MLWQPKRCPNCLAVVVVQARAVVMGLVKCHAKKMKYEMVEVPKQRLRGRVWLCRGQASSLKRCQKRCL